MSLSQLSISADASVGWSAATRSPAAVNPVSEALALNAVKLAAVRGGLDFPEWGSGLKPSKFPEAIKFNGLR
jgi:hypothetical protein